MISESFPTILTKKKMTLFEGGRGVCIWLTRNNPIYLYEHLYNKCIKATHNNMYDYLNKAE